MQGRAGHHARYHHGAVIHKITREDTGRLENSAGGDMAAKGAEKHRRAPIGGLTFNRAADYPFSSRVGSTSPLSSS